VSGKHVASMLKLKLCIVLVDSNCWERYWSKFWNYYWNGL